MGSGKNEYRRYATGGKYYGVAGYQHAKKAVPNTIVSYSATRIRKNSVQKNDFFSFFCTEFIICQLTIHKSLISLLFKVL